MTGAELAAVVCLHHLVRLASSDCLVRRRLTRLRMHSDYLHRYLHLCYMRCHYAIAGVRNYIVGDGLERGDLASLNLCDGA